MKFSKKISTVLLPALALSLMVSSPAHADDVFARLKAITSNMPAIKDAAIYVFFLIGLCGIGWGGMEMLKKSKGRGAEDISWGSIGLKFFAGCLLVGLTVTTDTMSSTVLGTSTSSASTQPNVN